jgi:hypothetical protein
MKPKPRKRDLAQELIKQRLQAAKKPVKGLEAKQYKNIKTSPSAPKLRRKGKKKSGGIDSLYGRIVANTLAASRGNQPNKESEDVPVHE